MNCFPDFRDADSHKFGLFKNPALSSGIRLLAERFYKIMKGIIQEFRNLLINRKETFAELRRSNL